jgi:fructose-1,6-bisphosphatase/inositol monophosphatase family enzyme
MKPNETEASALASFAAGKPASSFSHKDTSWSFFAQLALQDAGRTVRQRRLSDAAATHDGSAALEREVEAQMREAVKAFCPEASFLAGESGDAAAGLAVVFDAIDGMNSFRAHNERCAVAMAVLRDGVPFVSAVLNPATGELGHADEHGARLVQRPLFGEDAVAQSLPLVTWSESKPLLVNLHPFAQGRPFHRDFHSSWARGRRGIGIISATAGSPSWALLEAAKGHFVYLNIWGGGEAQAHDLAPGAHLLRAAGGNVVRTDGEPIPWVGHKGVFVAGAHAKEYESVAEVARVSKANLDALYRQL